MSEPSVVEATTGVFKRHPAWIIGGLVGLVAVFYLLSRGHASSPGSFSYSIGPTDTQLKTQTALAIAQNQTTAQTAMATTQAGIYSNYFGYLASAGQANNTTSVQLANIQANTANYKVSSDDSTALAISQTAAGTQAALIAAQTTQAQIAAGTTTHVSDNAAFIAQTQSAAALTGLKYTQDTTYKTTLLNSAAATQAAALAAQTTQLYNAGLLKNQNDAQLQADIKAHLDYQLANNLQVNQLKSQGIFR